MTVIAQLVEYAELRLYEFYGAPKPDGVTEKSLSISLPRNAIVDKYEVVVTAATAHAVTAGEAGQVRTTSDSGHVSVVVDFGTPRTVSAVAAPSGVNIQSISTWIGTEFGQPKVKDRNANYITLPSEVRTERLLVVVAGSPTTDQLATEMVLVVPESPSGIELRIDGGPPIFSQVSAVDAGSESELTAQSWNQDGARVVDVGPALAALTGTPLDDTTVTFTLTLSSRVPGKLDLALRPGGQQVRRIRRATFGGQSSREVAFEAEGRQELALDSLPHDLTVNEVRFAVTGRAPATRILPALGPEPPTPPFAGFALTSNRAACVRLPNEARIAELSGVRLALAGGSSGAEARVFLWRSVDATNLAPSEPLEGGGSEAVTLEPSDETWRTFSFKKPIALRQDYVLWAALVLNRGEASLTFVDASSQLGAERFLWGAPSGPWHELPAALSSARGRIRLIGSVKPETPFAPLDAQLLAAGAATGVVPNPKGTSVALSESVTFAGPPRLLLTSYAPLSFSLREVDVISTT